MYNDYKTTKRQDQVHLPARSNSLFLIPKAGNGVLIRSDPTTKQLYPIRSEIILLDPKSEKIRSDRIRIGFGSDLHTSTPNGLIPIEWIRIIDDIFAIWTQGIEKLQQFLTHINKFHPTIKFDCTYSHKTVNFLDTTIYINSNNKLESDLYIKPTDRTLLLHNNPQSCKNSIIYSQALRYRRIICDNSKLHERLNHLLVALIHRGYKYDTILTAFNKALEYNTQDELLSMQTTHKTNNRPIFPITYNNNTKYIAHILRKHWTLIQNDPKLQIFWPEPPVVAYKKNKTLKHTLVSTKLRTDNST